MKLARILLLGSAGVALIVASASAQPMKFTKRVRMTAPASMTKRFAHLPPVLPVSADPINVQKLQGKLAATKTCGLAEVAPGVVVRLDCHQYTRVTKSALHLAPRKFRALKAGNLSVRGGQAIRPMVRMKRFGPAPAPAPTATGTANADVKSAVGSSDGNGSIADSFPETVDHRALGLSGPIKNQGSVGACTAFALSTTIDNALRRAGREETISPTHVWAGYGMPNMQDAGDSNIGRNLATFSILPYSQRDACRLARHPYEECDEYVGVPKNSWKSDPTLVASLTKADGAGVVKVAAVEELATGPVNIDEVMEVLASGSDVWAALKIDGMSWSNRSMKNAVIPDWNYPTGGHAVTLSGYRQTPSGRQYMIHNSWGDSWGDKGYAWISEAMLKQHLKFAYRVKLEGEKGKPVELTDDDCAWDELIDSGTGQCGTICPDDSRPNNGSCVEEEAVESKPKKK
jgi:hypothetical protein